MTLCYTLEIDITGLNEDLVKTMREIGEKYDDFKVFNHGYDRLVFLSETGKTPDLFNELVDACEMYNVNFMSLLV